MQKNKVWVTLLRGVCLACMPLAVWASSPMVIQVVHDGEPNGFAAQVVEEWAGLLKERSLGALELQYDEEEEQDLEQALDDIKAGKNVIALMTLPALTTVVPTASPVTIAPDSATELLYMAYSQALRDQGLRIVMANYYSGVPLLSAKKPLYKRSDLAGLRIAVAAFSAQQPMIEAQGATPVVLDTKEVASALAYGTVDGAEGSLFTLYEQDWPQAARYVSAMGGEPTMTVWVGSDAFLDSLPSATQAMIVDTANEAGLFSQELAATYTEDITEELQGSGVMLIGFDTWRTVLPTELESRPNLDVYRVPTATTMTP